MPLELSLSSEVDSDSDFAPESIIPEVKKRKRTATVFSYPRRRGRMRSRADTLSATGRNKGTENT